MNHIGRALSLVNTAVVVAGFENQSPRLAPHYLTDYEFPPIEAEKFNGAGSDELLETVQSLVAMFRADLLTSTDEIYPPHARATVKSLTILGFDPSLPINIFSLSSRLAARLSAERSFLAPQLLTLLNLTPHDYDFTDTSQSTTNSSACPSPASPASRRRTFSHHLILQKAAPSTFSRPSPRLQLEVTKSLPTTSLTSSGAVSIGSSIPSPTSSVDDGSMAKSALKNLLPARKSGTFSDRGIRARVNSLLSNSKNSETSLRSPLSVNRRQSLEPSHQGTSPPYIPSPLGQTLRPKPHHAQTFPRLDSHVKKFPKLDPGLAALEDKSRLRVAVTCSICGRGGSDFNCCGKCFEAWCSRECRLEALRKNGGGRHKCSTRKVLDGPKQLPIASAVLV